jgi:integrase/recombinase XerD
MTTPVAGNFKPYIEGLIKQKRSLGYPYEDSARILRAFDTFCREHYPDESRLTKKLVMHWAEKRESEQVNGLACRLTPVRQLAKYMHRLGLEAYLLPPGLPGKLIRYVPHVFTDQELKAFFAEIDRCPVNPQYPARHVVMPVFFRVLYACGLRLSEARRLTVADVDLATGKLVIRQSKGHRERTVMMSEEVLDLCRVYQTQVSRLTPSRLAFFPNPYGQPYGRHAIDAWFRQFWAKTDFTHPSGNPPRVYDSRSGHTFAVKRLNLWVQEGKALTACLPYLSLYMGHAQLTATDYYLHLVPEFFPVVKEKSRAYGANLIPEVDYDRR